jgi:taurine dioxygenase
MNGITMNELQPVATSVQVKRVGAALGAEVTGVDLRRALTNEEMRVLNDALVEHQLLVFPDQSITQEQQCAFAERFGPLTVHPFSASLKHRPQMIVLDNDQDAPPLSTDQWHSDEMFQAEPPMATMLLTRIMPPVGGDTLFASMTAAYEGLSDPVKEFLCTLNAEFDFKVFRHLFSKTEQGRRDLVEIEKHYPNAIHPVVRVHPISKKRAVYVSPQATKRIVGMSEWESTAILQMLYHLPEIPEYQYRVQWRPNMVVIWDNRSTQHYATRDYLPHRRRMERVTIKGDRPIGVNGPVDAASIVDKSKVAQDRTRIKRDELTRPIEQLLAKIRNQTVT